MKILASIAAAVMLTAISVCGEVGSCSAADSEGWTSVREGVYFNEKSIVCLPDGTVSVWVKIVPADGSPMLTGARAELIDNGKYNQANMYDYSCFLSEIDCSAERHRELITILYDVNKNILYSTNSPQASWEAILPGSGLQLILAAVCGQ